MIKTLKTLKAFSYFKINRLFCSALLSSSALVLFLSLFSSSASAEPFNQIYFLPEHASMVLEKQHDLLTSAKKTVDVAMFGMTVAKNNPYVNDLVDACNRGIRVRIYRDQGQSDQRLSSLANDMIIKAGGKDKHCQVRVKSVRMPIQHSKYTIIDNTYVLWGSVNESASGMLQDNVEEYNEDGEIFESNFETIWKTGIDWSGWKNRKK
jgi:phosphatidylserine/phosphatidylglycerophosphate/cardiolipin synthase-like enzyme